MVESMAIGWLPAAARVVAKSDIGQHITILAIRILGKRLILPFLTSALLDILSQTLSQTLRPPLLFILRLAITHRHALLGHPRLAQKHKQHLRMSSTFSERHLTCQPSVFRASKSLFLYLFSLLVMMPFQRKTHSHS